MARTAGTMADLSLSLTDTNSVPPLGRITPPPICDLRNADAKSLAIPMTSPVDFISGDRTGSTPGKRANGKTDSLTAMCGTSRLMGRKFLDRKSGGEGKSGSVRGELGGG